LGQLRPRPFDIAVCELPAVLDDTLTLLRPNLIKNHILVKSSLAPDLPAVDASRAHILQVCLNIAMNAIDAMPGGGNLNVTLSPDVRRSSGCVDAIRGFGQGDCG
jgi:signal transduction histidine kinase